MPSGRSDGSAVAVQIADEAKKQAVARKRQGSDAILGPEKVLVGWAKVRDGIKVINPGGVEKP